LRFSSYTDSFLDVAKDERIYQKRAGS